MKHLLTFIHDSVGQTSLIGGNIQILLRKLKAGEILTNEDLINRLEDIKKWNSNVNQLIDKFYVDHKQYEQGKIKDTTARTSSITG